MKLYSRSELIKYLVITGLVVAVFVSLFAIIINKRTSKSVNDSVQISENLENRNELTNQEKSADSGNSTGIENYIQVSNEAKYTTEEAQNIYVYDNCNEAVVNINTQVTAYDWFLQPYVQEGGSGSGSIIDKQGYILTNVHVIQGATKIYVSLFDGTQYEAEVIGQDLDSDLAVIKFTPPEGMELKTISFGNSSELRVGQRAIAIGNPFGLERTITTGIVSGLGRPIQNSNNRIIRDMIQTDAAINPGNSGGPLLDTTGKMIGINTMIKSSSGSSAGVGFAVPSETAVRVVADLIRSYSIKQQNCSICRT